MIFLDPRLRADTATLHITQHYVAGGEFVVTPQGTRSNKPEVNARPGAAGVYTFKAEASVAYHIEAP